MDGRSGSSLGRTPSTSTTVAMPLVGLRLPPGRRPVRRARAMDERAGEHAAMRVGAKQDLRRPLRRSRYPWRTSRTCRGGRQRHGAVERDAAMRGAQTDQPAEARRRADRAAGVGSDGDVGEPAGDRGRRSRRRAAGDPVRSARDLPAAEKCAFWPISEKASSSVWVLPANRAPASSSVCTAACCRLAGAAFASLRGIAAAGDVAGDVENVLDAERQARQRPGLRIGNRHFRQIQEGVEGVAGAGHRSKSGYDLQNNCSTIEFFQAAADFN